MQAGVAPPSRYQQSAKARKSKDPDKQGVRKPSKAWKPQLGPQLDATVLREVDEIFFGGARGGGKSFYLLGDFLQDVPRFGQHWQGVLFRQSYGELEELIGQSMQIYPQTGAEWREGDKTWTWPNCGNARLRMRYLENARDTLRYQGHQYAWMGWDELTGWVDLESYHLMKACLRIAGENISVKRIRATGNPGGPGHFAVQRYFVDPAPLGRKLIVNDETGMSRMYIPSRVADNKILMENDPGYIKRLRSVGNAQLVKAWLEGDWSAVVGAYFDDFSFEKHVIEPFEIPEMWLRFSSHDWGSARPFVHQWFAVSDGSIAAYPAGAVIMYRELYGGKDNKGLKLSADEVGGMVVESQVEGERVVYCAVDPAAFKSTSGPSVAERLRSKGVPVRMGDNNRVSGWDQVRFRLRGEDGVPMLFIFKTCIDVIRTLPALQHDMKRAEDVDTRGDDHCGDALRYGCMSRPYARMQKEEEVIKTLATATMNDLWDEDERMNRRRRHRRYG